MEMMRHIFMYMMEEGFYPSYEKTHILFEFEDNPAILEYTNGILSVRIFFTIEEETFNIFLEASNSTMSETTCVKPVILEDRRTLMFSSETLCDNMREFKKFFPRSLKYLNDTLHVHKSEMNDLLQKNVLYKDLYTHNNEYDATKKLCS